MVMECFTAVASYILLLRCQRDLAGYAERVGLMVTPVDEVGNEEARGGKNKAVLFINGCFFSSLPPGALMLRAYTNQNQTHCLTARAKELRPKQDVYDQLCLSSGPAEEITASQKPHTDADHLSLPAHSPQLPRPLAAGTRPRPRRLDGVTLRYLSAPDSQLKYCGFCRQRTLDTADVIAWCACKDRGHSDARIVEQCECGMCL